MADVVLIHSAAGCRPAVHRAADRLRAGGHTVHVPDLYEGAVFDDLDEGVAHMKAIGWSQLLRHAQVAVAEIPGDLVLMGMSMGAGIAATLAQERPGARGAVLLYGPEVPEEPWPAGVPVLVQHAAADPWVDPGWEKGVFEHVGRVAPVTVHTYTGAQHLLDDADLVDQHDPAAAALIWSRVEAFLADLA